MNQNLLSLKKLLRKSFRKKKEAYVSTSHARYPRNCKNTVVLLHCPPLFMFEYIKPRQGPNGKYNFELLKNE